MRFKTKKQPSDGDCSIIDRILWNSFASVSKLSIVFLLFFSSSLLVSSNAFSLAHNHQQVPVKKVTVITKKSNSSKVVKGKIKSTKPRKSTVIKKDSLQDINPASFNSPLYKN